MLSQNKTSTELGDAGLISADVHPRTGLVRYAWFKFALVVALGCVSSSAIIWWNMDRSGGLYGGEPVTLSYLGQCFFLTLGAILGSIPGALIGKKFVRFVEVPRQNASKHWFMACGVSLVISPVVAGILFLYLSFMCIAIPDEVFRLLFDVP